jgi:hypothetical protein
MKVPGQEVERGRKALPDDEEGFPTLTREERFCILLKNEETSTCPGIVYTSQFFG